MNVTQKPTLHQEWIDPDALEIVRTLQNRGFTTYLVGGCVRDLLLGKHPKDYDITTNARPNEVRRFIRNSYVIGKRFRLVLVKRGDLQFEVATFRRDLRENEELPEHITSEDNIFGSPEEDARRRDFTVNSLMYDPINDQLFDYCNGLEDLKSGVVRMIGHPETRIKEDPIRILRGLRLAHLIGFKLEPEFRKSSKNLANLLESTPLPRRREEILKILRLNQPLLALLEAYDLDILKIIAPDLYRVYENLHQLNDFSKLYSQIQEINFLGKDPLFIFSGLIWSYFRSVIESNPLKHWSSQQIIENTKLSPLMKDQLGMFKSEQILIAKSIHMIPLLKKIDEYSQKGSRRQLAILMADAFQLAFYFAKLDHSLNANEVLFWESKLIEYSDKINEYKKNKLNESKTRKKRPAKNKSKVLEDNQINKDEITAK